MSKCTSNLALIKFIMLFAIALSPIDAYSQSPDILSEEFLAGLPPSVRDEIEVKNKVNEGIELENLFRSETSLDKNKIILKVFANNSHLPSETYPPQLLQNQLPPKISLPPHQFLQVLYIFNSQPPF